MPTRRQHYVPRVYLKSWECMVETKAEPDKQFLGVYAFEGSSKQGDGANRESILWKPQLYTVSFDHLFITQYCPKIYADFVDQVYDLLLTRYRMPVYGKLGYSTIKTKVSIRKHLREIDQWDFFYVDGNLARKKAILADIDALNSYLIENGMDAHFESNWSRTLTEFISQMKSDGSGIVGQSERKIDESVTLDILSFFFMMLCRSPKFDGLGIYTWIREVLLEPVFGGNISGFMDGLWYTELYRMIYKSTGGHFHSFLSEAIKRCQIILFEAYDDAGSFITSDNPAFQNINFLETTNMNGLVFPVSPKYLLFICRGENGINFVDYRFADRNTVLYFNNIIYRNKISTAIGTEKELDKLLS